MNSQSEWRHSISAYTSEELNACTFSSMQETDRAIGAFWEDPELKGMPSEIVSGRTIIIPGDAVPMLRSRGFSFESDTVLDSHSLEREALAKMRREHGM